MFEVSNKSFEGANKSFEGRMSVAAEMHEIVTMAGGHEGPVKARVWRAARRLDITFARARAHTYRLARQIPAEEADKLRAARSRLLAERMAAIDLEKQRIAAELARLARTRGDLDGGAVGGCVGMVPEPGECVASESE